VEPGDFQNLNEDLSFGMLHSEKDNLIDLHRVCFKQPLDSVDVSPFGWVNRSHGISLKDTGCRQIFRLKVVGISQMLRAGGSFD
jgi:hypothetical protein